MIFRLPFFDQTQNMFTKLFSRETNVKSITHKSHQHPLILVDTMTNVEALCDGCLRPIMDMPFYKCRESKCEFVLHELCTRLPSTLDYNCQGGHRLLLCQDAIRCNAFCRVCNHFCKGFFYSCFICSSPYTVDVMCALVIETIRHKSHLHLLSRVEKRLNKDYCRMCLSGFRSKEESSFSCDTCNFHLHRECALLLPETIRHRYDKHPITLCCSPIENHEGDYFCEDCEEELNPYISFYQCHVCVQSIHSACAQLKPLPKSIILYGLSEKLGGSQNTHQNRFHDHPLSFVHDHPLSFVHRINYELRGCSECHLNLRNDFILMCLRCDYAMHADHLNERDDPKYDTIHINEYPYHQHPLRLSRFMATTSVSCSQCGYDIERDVYVFACSICRFAMHAYHFNRNGKIVLDTTRTFLGDLGDLKKEVVLGSPLSEITDYQYT
ncbi:uncharacterized protein LOC143537385 [Bidens hawaiensis]|uniref:uncharacterized protein LOC143537385 n=1 Tax=Bidens hawaiensis TaxID=980011 RepID=UPI00404B852F